MRLADVAADRLLKGSAVASLLALLGLWRAIPAGAQDPGRVAKQTLIVTSDDAAGDMRAADRLIDGLVRTGELQLLEARSDPFIEGRVHQRFHQLYRGIPVFGGQIVRQLDRGQLVSAFGSIFSNVNVDDQPALSPEAALAAVGRAGFTAVAGARVDLLVLPAPSGAYALAYRLGIVTPEGTATVFVDANSGSILLALTDLRSQAAVGVGTGVLGDTKKVSASQAAGAYVSQDQLRPPELVTYDLRGNLPRVLSFLNGVAALGPADLGTARDNTWTDGPIVDAHAYEGWVYDYYFKRFGRRGLDDHNVRIRGIVHPVRLADFASASAGVRGTFYANAFYNDRCRCMVYGEGLPEGATISLPSGRFGLRPFAAALDVVAHELTHAVTAASSNLVYLNESGALNEAFSDIMGTSVEFFYEPSGVGPLRADYLGGEDLLVPFAPGAAFRSLQDPAAFGQPDHYGLRACIGAPGCDSGGVHINSGIANQAFYLAIEGGTNRVSGRTVQGVGPGNREQIEKIFYRSFTAMLPSTATFFAARMATIQSARDLYGAGSAAERAVTQGWDAVGVTSPGSALTTRFTPSAVPASSTTCGGSSPGFSFGVTVSEFQNVGFNVGGFNLYLFDGSGNALGAPSRFSARDFASIFNACGPGDTRIPPNGQKCANVCVFLGGRSTGFGIWEFFGVDDNGNAGVFQSDTLPLGLSPSGQPLLLPGALPSPADLKARAEAAPGEPAPDVRLVRVGSP